MRDVKQTIYALSEFFFFFFFFFFEGLCVWGGGGGGVRVERAEPRKREYFSPKSRMTTKSNKKTKD